MSGSDLDDKLAALQRKMAELRSQLGTGASIPSAFTSPTASAPPSDPARALSSTQLRAAPAYAAPRATELLPPVPQGAADREPFVSWLIAAVRVRSGIAVEDQVRQKLQRITSRLPLSELEKWLSLLSTVESGHPEWLALLESVTNHETYFFRDLGQLEHLQREVLAKLVERERSKLSPSITIWSAASSTGEELYSVAMLLLEALEKIGEVESDGPSIRAKARWRLRLLGTDLSRQAVRIANAGVYDGGAHTSFRKFPSRFSRFFEPPEEGDPTFQRIRNGLRQGVTFQTFNLMDTIPPVPACDVVLCRNVLIYFDADGKRAVWSLVHRALATDGIALFGPTDVLDDPRFTPIWGTSTVLYRKR
jgi:chemotaxis protein methyltransferase CheR